MSLINTIRTRAASTWNAMRGKAPANAAGMSTGGQFRTGTGLGLWSGISDWFVPRQVNPHLYEALREAIAPIDGAINRMTTVDGILAVEGDNDALVQEITDWMDNIQVNDLECGFQAFADSLGNEKYEQGFALGEFIVDAKQRDVVALRVADSKGVLFRRGEKFEAYYQPPARAAVRGDGTDRVEQILRNTYGAATTGELMGQGFKPLDLSRVVYQSIHNEADNPYGVSLMRSMEFVATILLQIQNATGQVWQRYGDPSLSLIYKTSNRKITGTDLDARRNALAADLAKVLDAKRKGNSLDLVAALAADDEIKIEVIGAQDKVIEIEMPARHMLEQIVAKTGLPSWMLGFHWSTAERLAESQGIIVLQESQTRFARTKPALKRVIETMLRLRGRTWKPGDWDLVQRLPNLADELKRAQAEFLRAQTELMLSGVITPGVNSAAGQGRDADKHMARLRAIANKIVGFGPEQRILLLGDDDAIDRLIAETEMR